MGVVKDAIGDLASNVCKELIYVNQSYPLHGCPQGRRGGGGGGGMSPIPPFRIECPPPPPPPPPTVVLGQVLADKLAENEGGGGGGGGGGEREREHVLKLQDGYQRAAGCLLRAPVYVFEDP